MIRRRRGRNEDPFRCTGVACLFSCFLDKSCDSTICICYPYTMRRDNPGRDKPPGYEGDNYTLTLFPGDILNIKALPISSVLYVGLQVSDSTGGQIGYGQWGSQAQIQNLALPATGTYTINVETFNENGVVAYGAYTLFVGCISRSGTEIAPGESPSDATPSNTETISTPTPFSGTGFPGLPPVDFSGVALIPIQSGVPITSAVTPAGGEILGYTLDANSGDTVDLSFERLSGNLNLGLVVLSSNNEVVFQASLITTSTLDTNFVIPGSGTYTIGVL